MTFDEQITSLTQDEILPAVYDTILGSNVLTLRLLGNAKPWSGHKYKVPIKVERDESQGSFDGFDTFSTTRSNTRKVMEFEPKGYYKSVVVSNIERAVNETAKVMDLIGVEMDSAQQDMSDGIGDLMYGDGTGNSNKDFTGLAAAVDDGSVAASYGGLSRSTYTTIQSNVTTGVGNLTLSTMATSYDAAVKGSDRPTLIVTTEAVWSYYEELLQPTVSANYNAEGFSKVTKNGMMSARGALQGEAGFDALFYRGVPMVKDEKCTAGYMYFLNEKYLEFRSLPHPDNASRSDAGNIEGVYKEDEKPPVFSWTGWKVPTNQDAIISQFIIYGELINKNPNRSSVLQGITGA